MKFSTVRNKAAASVGAIALTAFCGVMTASPAQAANPGYRCTNWKTTTHGWTANCTVTSGKARAMAECYDGTSHYGRWMGRGNWKFGMSCGKSKLGAYDVEWKRA
ncbi:hypothetical protein [Streptomyces sp. NPDC059063]|uniref:hypothetical protein n=1 Tax=unclassified Streptomyces TaxID=2593676 RepID=UPI0036C1236A